MAFGTLNPSLRRGFSVLVLLLAAGVAGAQSAGQLPRFFTTPFVTENQFIESSILRDVAGMLAYAGTGKAAAVELTCEEAQGKPPIYRLALPSGTVTISVPSALPLWEPARYDAAVLQIASALKLEKPTQDSKPDGDILHELENPRLQTLALLSENLSRKLKTQMLDRAAHEQAALLLAAFALRERLEPLDDQRCPLNRLTAHLAVGRWVSNGKAGLEGRYALTTAYVLMNLQTNALARLRQLEQEPQTNLRWNRALYTRLTGDHRALAALPASGPSLLEWAERIRAVSLNVSQEAAFKDTLKFVKANGQKDLNSDFIFAIFQAYRPGSVGLGRELYLDAGLKALLLDVVVASQGVRNSAFNALDGQELARRLNVEPGPCVHPDGQIAVLDWGTWAMQFQRRFAVYYTRSLDFMRHQWGLLEADVEQSRKPLDQLLSRLWLVPCYAGALGHSAQAFKVYDVVATRPQVVPMRIMRDLSEVWYTKIEVRSPATDPNVAARCAVLRYGLTFPIGTLLGIEGNLHWFQPNCDLKEVLRQAPFNLRAVRTYLGV